MRLLILSSNTGEGHNSAARAIQDAAISIGWQVSLRKPLEESGLMNRALAGSYNFMLTYHPNWVGVFFQIVNLLRPNEANIFYRLKRNYVRQFIESEQPDIVLSVHPMLNHMIQRYMREESIQVPSYTFITDPFPPFWKGWASEEVNKYFVMTAEAESALVNYGVHPNAIEQSGIPLREGFHPRSTSEITLVREKLGLPDRTTILVNGGARGGKPLVQLVKAVRSAAPMATLLVVCGTNQRSQSKLKALNDRRIRVYGFVNQMHLLLGASDLVVTKPGTLATYESLASMVPAVLSGIGGLMPQESGLFQAASKYGFGFAVNTFEELQNVIKLGTNEWQKKHAYIAKFHKLGAARDIITRIQASNASTYE